MSEAVVFDASAFIAMLLDEELPINLANLLTSPVPVRLVVPPLWIWEVSNAILLAARRGRGSIGDLTQQVQDFLGFALDIDEDALQRTVTITVVLGRDHGLTAYDAAYLELAIRRDLPLATLDRRLAAVARNIGVEVIGSPA